MGKKKEKKYTQEDVTRITKVILAVMLMFVSIVTIEIITIVYMSKIEADALMLRDNVPVSYIKYTDTGRVFKKLEVTQVPTFIKEGCESGCNLQTEAYGKKYKYIFERNEKGEYLLSIVNDEEYITYKENIGISLRQAYFRMYNDYLTFVTVVNKNEIEYDHVVIVDNKNAIDRFSSLDANEIEFTKNGIVYYYDNCLNDKNVLTNGEIVKASRLPFSVETKIIEKGYMDISWCEKKN